MPHPPSKLARLLFFRLGFTLQPIHEHAVRFLAANEVNGTVDLARGIVRDPETTRRACVVLEDHGLVTLTRIKSATGNRIKPQLTDDALLLIEKARQTEAVAMQVR